MKPWGSGGDWPLWVESSHWELDNPVTGDVLLQAGIRISGTVEPAQDDVEGIWPISTLIGSAKPATEHIVSGRVVSAVDFQYNLGDGPQHGGARVVLSVNGDLMQATVTARAHDFEPGSTLTLRGDLSLVYCYEWEAFDLHDTRRSWSVEGVRNLEGGHYFVLLRPQVE